MRRLLLVVLLAFAGLVCAAPAAVAVAAVPAVDICKNPPTPEDPYLNGVLATGIPATLPAPGDPFDGTGRTTLFEQYGTAGTAFDIYDTGCLAGSNAVPAIMTDVANLVGLAPKFVVALTASFGNWVLNPTWLSILDQPVDAVSKSLFDSFTQPFMPSMLIVAAIAIAYSARRARWSSALTSVAFIFAGFALVFVSLAGPSKLAHTFDELMSTGVTAAMSGNIGSPDPSVKENPGTRLMSKSWETLAYNQWLQGTLGSADSQTAKTYGPRLFKAHAMSWAEANTAHQSVGAMTALVDAKKNDWTTTAAEIQAADPAAYENLTGNKGWQRIGSAVAQWPLMIILVIFPLVSLGMVLFGYLIFRYVAAFLPVLGVLLTVPRWHSVLRFVGNLLAAAVVNSIIFAAGGSAIIAISNGLLASPLPQWLALIIIGVCSLAAWMMLRPFRSLTNLVRDPSKGMTSVLEAPAQAFDTVRSLAGTVATKGADSLGFDDDDEPQDAVRPEVQDALSDSPGLEAEAEAGRPELEVAEPLEVTEPEVAAPRNVLGQDDIYEEAEAAEPPLPAIPEQAEPEAAKTEDTPTDEPEDARPTLRPEVAEPIDALDDDEPFMIYDAETDEFVKLDDATQEDTTQGRTGL